jgi:hypothetical protein
MPLRDFTRKTANLNRESNPKPLGTIFVVCSHIYSLLLEEDLCECQNISAKFPCVLLVYLYLSSGDFLVFSVSFPLFIPIFVLHIGY